MERTGSLRPDHQQPFLTLLISPSKLISFELPFNSAISSNVRKHLFIKPLIINCDEYLFRVRFQNFFTVLFSCLCLHPLKPLQSLPHLHLISTISISSSSSSDLYHPLSVAYQFLQLSVLFSCFKIASFIE